MISFSRTDDSLIGSWWWTIDRVLLFSFLGLIFIGILMAAAATPMVANRIGIEEFYFLKRHLMYIIPSVLTIFFVSTMEVEYLKKFSIALFTIAMFLTFMTFFFGSEIKGAKRWISIGGFSIQPSEFAKPALAIITAWLLSEQKNYPKFRGKLLSAILYFSFVFLLVLQPDVGMILLTTAVWLGQLFVNGFPIIYAIGLGLSGVGALILAYFFLPHVTARIDKFLNPAIGDHYQIDRSLEAFANGGLFGMGPGEGIVKKHLPDAHADFVFAVLGEEFGFFICAFVVILIAFIVVYGMLKALKESDLFTILSSVGLLSQFGLQAFVNIASALLLIPTKGMTLPFISYGGSSMIAASITAGMILALVKKKIINYEEYVQIT
ncbi:MAG: putative lipid II flippase FtsW [Alphaproteobacteria bacterium]|nr:putative lipid II flippase FtsW [Alphaproteobacteria bacterium]